MNAGWGDCHSASHRHLLRREPSEGPEARIDAVVVPTARPVAYLRPAMDLARELKAPLIALCSRRSATENVEPEARNRGIRLLAVDIPAADALAVPALETDALLAAEDNRRFRRRADTSLKRNIALLMARMIGWRRIAFLDDDMAVKEPSHLRRAAALLSRYDCVGLINTGYPDNSVVCHAYRQIGGAQDEFVGGGALVVDPARGASFFPNIYNEDWFYLLDEEGLRPIALTGAAHQARFDPFRDAHRARAEEFGDVLAEGLFWLLDHGRAPATAGPGFWSRFLSMRERFINGVLERTGLQARTPDRDRRIESLKAARGRLKLITPELCADWLAAWRADRARWREHGSSLPERVPAETALKELGLTRRAIVGPLDA